jgi:hypothetical protein
VRNGLDHSSQNVFCRKVVKCILNFSSAESLAVRSARDLSDILSHVRRPRPRPLLESVPGSLRHRDLTHPETGTCITCRTHILGPVRPRRLLLYSVQYTLISLILCCCVDRRSVALIRGCWARKVQRPCCSLGLRLVLGTLWPSAGMHIRLWKSTCRIAVVLPYRWNTLILTEETCNRNSPDIISPSGCILSSSGLYLSISNPNNLRLKSLELQAHAVDAAVLL